MGSRTRRSLRRALALACLTAGLAGVSEARADANLFVGVVEDGLKWRTAETARVGRDLGLSAYRVSLSWRPGQTQPSALDVAQLTQAVVGAAGARIVLAAYADAPARPETTPVDVASRREYCTFLRNTIERFPQINDVVVWNEPNISLFWKPQFNADGTSASPTAYEALLAECWTTLHQFRAGVNVIGVANSPWGNNNANAGEESAH